ncbi:ComF family protein [Rhizobium sp. RCC_161_2]|uniref:ComF family protein n=1 Tax=Rhizobium sp. RCC_161_2 TaxID=3239219 RepID=UPI0035259831
MEVKIKRLSGNWDDGYALDKHMLSSTFVGYNASGYPMFDNHRTEAGEAIYKLKYGGVWDNSPILAKAVLDNIVPRFPGIGLVVPMPASETRARQPVNEVASDLAKLMKVTSFDGIIVKAPSATGKKLKDLGTKEAKDAELAGRFSINDAIVGNGKWNALLVDDLFDSGASMEAATKALRSYAKIDGIYVVALTWK